MSPSRIESLQSILARDSKDALARYMLANELYKEGRYQEAIDSFMTYLGLKEDEGAAYRTMAEAYLQLGKVEEARTALEKGVAAALKYHHSGMAAEFEERLRELES